MAYKRTIIITGGEYQKYYEGMYVGDSVINNGQDQSFYQFHLL